MDPIYFWPSLHETNEISNHNKLTSGSLLKIGRGETTPDYTPGVFGVDEESLILKAIRQMQELPEDRRWMIHSRLKPATHGAINLVDLLVNSGVITQNAVLAARAYPDIFHFMPGTNEHIPRFLEALDHTSPYIALRTVAEEFDPIVVPIDRYEERLERFQQFVRNSRPSRYMRVKPKLACGEKDSNLRRH